jgi:hypothetical protein
VVGRFIWMKNSGNEAKRMWCETGDHYHLLDTVLMDSKANDYDLFREFKLQRNMTLLTVCRKHMNKTPERKKRFDL